MKKYSNDSEAGTRSVTFSKSALIESSNRFEVLYVTLLSYEGGATYNHVYLLMVYDMSDVRIWTLDERAGQGG